MRHTFVAACLCAFLVVAAFSATPEERAKTMLAKMTLEEKLWMLYGQQSAYTGTVPANTRLGIPALLMNDGPQGYRYDEPSGTTTNYPSALSAGATFDLEIAAAWGKAMGQEFFLKGANVQLGPGMCLHRIPLNGRNFEYISGEDPVLGYYMVQPVVRGIQGQHVIANAKHYVNNNQETDRTTDDSIVDRRTRHELYYQPFQGAAEAGVGSIMCSYNKINGRWACENPETLGDLRNHLGFQGWVMSDWGATHSVSINDGLDQQMPDGSFMNGPLAAAIKAGNVTIDTVDTSVLRMLTPMYQVGLFDIINNNNITANVTSPERSAVARRIAQDSTVLLKNENDVLPLKLTGTTGKPLRIAMFGTAAHSAPFSHGTGSGAVHGPYTISPWQGLAAALNIPLASPSCNADTPFDMGYDYYQPGNPSAPGTGPLDCCTQCANRTDFTCNFFSYESASKTCYFKSTSMGRTPNSNIVSGTCRKDGNWQCNADGTVCIALNDGDDQVAAKALSVQADYSIVVVGAESGEGHDRSNLSVFYGGDYLVEVIAAVAGRSIVAMSSPGAILTPWRESVDAILINFYHGQEAGLALADVLLGTVNPSAKLPLTLPNVENEMGITDDQWPGVNLVSNYTEKLNVGYRWYNSHQETPAYCFGHGLSYTKFAYSDLLIESNVNPTKGNSSVTVLFTVTNVGTVAGREVPQLYMTYPPLADEPPRQLRQFTKTPLLRPGEKSHVSLTTRASGQDLSVFDIAQDAWVMVSGDWTIEVGASVNDIRLSGTIPI